MSPYSHEDPRLAIHTMEKEMENSSFSWTWQETLLTIPLALIVLGTIFGNFLVLYCAITKPSTLRLPTHFLIANLAMADFLVGVLVMPFLATLQVTGRWYFGSVYCEAWTVIHFWLCSSSILSTCAVCIERYIGVRHPLNHKSIMRRSRIWGLIIAVWVCAGILSLSSIYIWPEPKTGLPYVCEINQQKGHVILAVVGILYIPAAIMIILYSQIFIIASRHLKFMKHNSTVGLNISPEQKSASEKERTGFGRFFNTSKIRTISLEAEASTSEVTMSSSSPRGSSEDLGQQNMSSNGNNQSNKKDSAVSGTSNDTVFSSASSSNNTNASLVKNVHHKKQINLARRLCFLVAVLLASYLPFFTLYLIMAFQPGSIDLRIFNFFGWIRYFNSCLNPLLYAYAVPAFRKAMSQVVVKGFGKLQELVKVK